MSTMPLSVIKEGEKAGTFSCSVCDSTIIVIGSRIRESVVKGKVEEPIYACKRGHVMPESSLIYLEKVYGTY